MCIRDSIDGGDILDICAMKDSASIIVETTGGAAPFTYHLKGIPTNGDPEFVEIITNQESGDTFYVKPAVSSHYKLDSIVDALGCSLDLTGLMDSVLVTVEGPLDWVGNGNMVMDQSSCTLDTLKFGVSASTRQDNGAGTILYQWLVSTDNGATFQNVINGTPYSNADTDTLVISNPDGLNGYQYFAKVFTETCDTLTSDIATLSVEGPFVVNASPTDITACGLDMIEFTADTENLGTGLIKKQWYYIDHNEATPTWTKINDGINGDGVDTQGRLRTL